MTAKFLRDLKELDVVAVGDQRKLLTAIANLSCPSAPLAEPTPRFPNHRPRQNCGKTFRQTSRAREYRRFRSTASVSPVS
jgi:hypothetical protein